MIKVVIADDIQILRQGLKAILEQDGDIEVTGLAGDGLQAFLLCKEKKPDVALMDMRMPEYDGAYAIRRIKEELPGVKILVLTTFDDRETVDAALENGADGYILKEMGDDAVIRSVKAVCTGVRVFGDSVFRSLRETASAKPEPGPGAFNLTDRERDIVRLVAQGMDNREIARTLYLAEGTVRNNLSRVLEKLELKDRTQLAVFAVKNKISDMNKLEKFLTENVRLLKKSRIDGLLAEAGTAEEIKSLIDLKRKTDELNITIADSKQY